AQSLRVGAARGGQEQDSDNGRTPWHKRLPRLVKVRLPHSPALRNLRIASKPPGRLPEDRTYVKLVAAALLACTVQNAGLAQRPPGAQGSRNVRVLSHLP